MEGTKVIGKSIPALRRLAPVAAVFAAMMFAGASRADEGITVQGSGSAKGRPTQVDIECTLSGDAELASDATVKFRDAKKRAVAAIEGMKNPDLSVVSEGLSINNALDAQTQMMLMRGGGGSPGKPRVQILEKSHIILANADKMEPDALLETVLKILDVAKDAGYQVDPAPPSNYYEAQMSQFMGNTMVTFKVPDGTVLRDAAYKAAFDDAKSKAQKLAEIAGIKLGKVISVQEVPSNNKMDMSGLPNYLSYAMTGVMSKMSAAPSSDERAIVGTNTGDINKHVNLSVQFEIVK